MSDKLTTLFKSYHARRYSGINFEIKRSVGGFTATSVYQTRLKRVF